MPALTYRAAPGSGAWSFVSVHGGLLERLGTTAEELCGDPSRWVLMIHREDRERVVAARQRAASSGRLEVEYRLHPADGEECWVHEVAVRRPLGEPQMCGLVTDLTGHHRADDTLEQLHDARLAAVTEQLRVTSVRGTTVQLFVHDMRSPLTAVAGLARTLHERGAEFEPEDRDRVLERIAAATDRVLELVDDFAHFWGLPLAEPSVPTLPVSLDSVMASVLAEVGGAGDRVQVEVADVFAEAPPQLLQRVLVGLVRNALDHTPEDTRVRVSARNGPGRVVVDVQDDGPGIPEALRGELFEQRVHVADDGQGMGLGLTLVRAAIDLLGGQVRALHSPSGGTVIRVELPGPAVSGASGLPREA